MNGSVKPPVKGSGDLAWRTRARAVTLVTLHAMVATGLFACVTRAPAGGEYERERAALVQRERNLRFDANVALTPDEEAADAVLGRLRVEERKRLGDTPIGSRSFLVAKDDIDGSPLLEVFRRLPKGGALHLHPSATGDFRWLIERATYLPNCYVDKDGKFKFWSSPEPDWQLVADLRAAADDSARFDQALYESITLGPEDVKTPNIWKEFESCFDRISGLVNYLPVYREYYTRMLVGLAHSGVQHVELRLFLDGFYDDGGDVTDKQRELGEWQTIIRRAQDECPELTVRIIYTEGRWLPRDQVVTHVATAAALHRDHPDLVVGLDLVGEEDALNSTRYYSDALYRDAPTAPLDLVDALSERREEGPLELVPLSAVLDAQLGDAAPDSDTSASGLDAIRADAETAPLPPLPYYFHAGESNRPANENLYDAVLLGTRRIGHGIALPRHPVLLDRVRERGIAVEVCPISNQVLGYVADLRGHPAVDLMNRGVQIVLSSDDQGMMRYELPYDWYEACLAWDLDLRALKRIARNSLEFSALRDADKRASLAAWEVKWADFVKWLCAEYGAPDPSD